LTIKMQKVIIALIALAACALAGSIKPIVGCAVHYKSNTTLVAESEDEVNQTIIAETKIMHNDDSVYIYQSATTEEGNVTGLVRCIDGECYIKIEHWNEEEDAYSCNESSEHQFDPTFDDEFHYDQEKGTVPCPYEGISDCKMYCNSTLDVCATFDSKTRVVVLEKANNFTNVYTYLETAVTVADFAGKNCSGKDLPPLEDICAKPASSSAKPASSSAKPASSSAKPASSSAKPASSSAKPASSATPSSSGKSSAAAVKAVVAIVAVAIAVVL